MRFSGLFWLKEMKMLDKAIDELPEMPSCVFDVS